MASKTCDRLAFSRVFYYKYEQVRTPGLLQCYSPYAIYVAVDKVSYLLELIDKQHDATILSLDLFA